MTRTLGSWCVGTTSSLATIAVSFSGVELGVRLAAEILGVLVTLVSLGVVLLQFRHYWRRDRQEVATGVLDEKSKG